MYDEHYKILRVISDSSFLVLDVQDITTGEKTVTYLLYDIDLKKDLYSEKELQII